MLVLSRGIGEKLIICDNIIVEILDIRGTQVRVGITAPSEVSIDREEIHHKKRNGK